MRKAWIYLKYYWLTILLVIFAIIFWVVIDANKIDPFKSGLLSSILGVGIAITFNENRKSIVDHKRRKRTFGMLKLITIPYLKNQYDGMITTMKLNNDICDFNKAFSFIVLVSEFDKIGSNFDNNWMQLIYSQGFMDAIESDDQFNKISQQILEIMRFIKTITDHSVTAKSLIALFNVSDKTDIYKNNLIQMSKTIRDEISDSARCLQKYTNNLDNEIEIFLKNNGTKYSEFER